MTNNNQNIELESESKNKINKTLAKYDIINSLGVIDINTLFTENFKYYFGDVTESKKLLFSAYISTKGYIDIFIENTIDASNYIYSLAAPLQDNISYYYNSLYEPIYNYIWGEKKTPINSQSINNLLDVNKLDVNKLDVNKLDVNKLDVNKLDVNKLDVNEYGIFDDVENDILELENSYSEYQMMPFNTDDNLINEVISEVGEEEVINYVEENIEEQKDIEDINDFEQDIEEQEVINYDVENNLIEEDDYFTQLINRGVTDKKALFYAYYYSLLKSGNIKK